MRIEDYPICPICQRRKKDSEEVVLEGQIIEYAMRLSSNRDVVEAAKNMSNLLEVAQELRARRL